MPRGPLSSLRCVVTGASSGIGHAIARAFAQAGAAVLVHYHSHREEAEALVEEIRAQGGTAHALAGSLEQAGECERLMREAQRLLGGIDVLVANAGIQQDAAFTDMSLEQWRRVIDLNLTGQFLCAQHAVRAFRGQGLGMAQELAGEKIRVNALAPGAIRTPINEPAWSTPQAMEQLLRLIPYGRIGEPEDVARAAVWLASDDSDYVVGTTLFVDGAMSLYPAFREGG